MGRVKEHFLNSAQVGRDTEDIYSLVNWEDQKRDMELRLENLIVKRQALDKTLKDLVRVKFELKASLDRINELIDETEDNLRQAVGDECELQDSIINLEDKIEGRA